MVTIEIHDEQLALKLQQIADSEQRSLEALLRRFVADYPIEPVSTRLDERPDNGVKQVRYKAFAKARRYWQSVGDHEKAALSDEILDATFGAFDEEGIPRLQTELKTLEPPIGSLAYAAKVIREQGGIMLGGNLDVTKIDDILNEEFTDYLLARMKDQDGER